MFSPKRLAGLLMSSILFASCSPFPPTQAEQEAAKKAEAAAKAKANPKKTKSAAELKKEADRRKARIKANKEAADRRARLKKKRAAEKAKSSSSSGSSGGSGNTVTPPKVPKKPVVKPKSKYRTAMSIPGKPGFVFNPWTNKAVDVRGIPGGSVVRDPNDGNPDHKFRVP